MNFRPFVVATYGVYLAAALSALSVWLGTQAGASFDFALMRAVFVFVIFTALAFGAEAVMTVGWRPPEPVPATIQDPETPDE